MTVADAKTDLVDYLQEGRDVLLLKAEGLAEYDVRRPLTPTGTNLLGLLKHLAVVEVGYFSVPFARRPPGPHPWFDDESEPNADMWATAEEPRDAIVAGYREAWAHTDAAIAALPLDAVGRVPWWGPEGRDVTLHRVLVHVVAETHRHAGHADIVRELVDGSVGYRAVGDNLPPGVDAAWWAGHRDRLEAVARQAGGR